MYCNIKLKLKRQTNKVERLAVGAVTTGILLLAAKGTAVFAMIQVQLMRVLVCARNPWLWNTKLCIKYLF
jgi:hypothetical protein